MVQVVGMPALRRVVDMLLLPELNGLILAVLARLLAGTPAAH